jgi:hypothetical protein
MGRCRKVNPDFNRLTTGQAAAMLCMSAAGFRRKFLKAFLAQHAVFLAGSGNYMWARSLVEHLRDMEPPSSAAS